jgi:hypothetical protein
MTANRQQLVNKSMDSNHPQIVDDFEKLFSIPWGHHWHIIGRTAYLCSTLIPALSVDRFIHQGGHFIQIDENIIQRGAFVLLVSTIWAMRRPLHRGASDEASAPRLSRNYILLLLIINMLQVGV